MYLINHCFIYLSQCDKELFSCLCTYVYLWTIKIYLAWFGLVWFVVGWFVSDPQHLFFSSPRVRQEGQESGVRLLPHIICCQTYQPFLAAALQHENCSDVTLPSHTEMKKACDCHPPAVKLQAVRWKRGTAEKDWQWHCTAQSLVWMQLTLYARALRAGPGMWWCACCDPQSSAPLLACSASPSLLAGGPLAWCCATHHVTDTSVQHRRINTDISQTCQLITDMSTHHRHINTNTSKHTSAQHTTSQIQQHPRINTDTSTQHWHINATPTYHTTDTSTWHWCINTDTSTPTNPRHINMAPMHQHRHINTNKSQTHQHGIDASTQTSTLTNPRQINMALMHQHRHQH